MWSPTPFRAFPWRGLSLGNWLRPADCMFISQQRPAICRGYGVVGFFVRM